LKLLGYVGYVGFLLLVAAKCKLSQQARSTLFRNFSWMHGGEFSPRPLEFSPDSCRLQN